MAGPRKASQLGQHAGVAGQHAGIVHHLSQAVDRAVRQQSRQSSGGLQAVRRSSPYGVAGTQEGAIMNTLSGRARLHSRHETDAGHAGHIGDLMRIGDDAGDAVRAVPPPQTAQAHIGCFRYGRGRRSARA